MALLPPHLLPSPIQAPPAEQVIEDPQWRIEILSETVIRLEWDPSGEFLDGPTQMMAWRKCLPVKDLRIDRDEAGGVVTARNLAPMDCGLKCGRKIAGAEPGVGGQTQNFPGFKGETCEGQPEHWTRSMDAVNSIKVSLMAVA